jgi:hypothetical protein
MRPAPEKRLPWRLVAAWNRNAYQIVNDPGARNPNFVFAGISAREGTRTQQSQTSINWKRAATPSCRKMASADERCRACLKAAKAFMSSNLPELTIGDRA